MMNEQTPWSMKIELDKSYEVWHDLVPLHPTSISFMGLAMIEWSTLPTSRRHVVTMNSLLLLLYQFYGFSNRGTFPFV
jgi:hypothetical protein